MSPSCHSILAESLGPSRAFIRSRAWADISNTERSLKPSASNLSTKTEAPQPISNIAAFCDIPVFVTSVREWSGEFWYQLTEEGDFSR